MRIASIETRVYRYPLDPAFNAAWDPVPRTHQDATIVVVRSDDGVEGYASGDGVPDRELLERLLMGADATDAEGVRGILETVDFHHGRNWTLEIAIWDLVGRSRGEALWRMLGGTRDRVTAYASTGELVSADERVRRCVALRDAGSARSSFACTLPTGDSTSRSLRPCGTESAATSRSWWTRTRAGACPET